MFSFDKSRVDVIDTVRESVIVRGPAPIYEDDWGVQFAYDDLAERLSDFEIDLESSILLDVSFVDCMAERWILKCEAQAYGVPIESWPISYWPPYKQSDWNPKTIYGTHLKLDGKEPLGRFMWWPFKGLRKGESADQTLGDSGWGLMSGIRYIRKQAISLNGAPLVIYAHCTAGEERTSAFHACWLMTYKKMDAKKAIKIANSIGNIKKMPQCYEDVCLAYYDELQLSRARIVTKN